MSLHKIKDSFESLDSVISSIDEEYPNKFYVDFSHIDDKEREIEIILNLLKYFNHQNYEFSYSTEYHKENGYDVDYKNSSNIECIKGILIIE